MISVNVNKCTGCSICTKVCPVGVLEIDENHKAAVIPENAEKCFLCGQCEAHCPDNAIEVSFDGGYSYEGELNPAKITPEQMAFHMTSRRSVRHYKPTQVPKEKVAELLEIVRFAPTGMNAQEIKWLVVYNGETMQKIKDLFCEWATDTLDQDSKFAMGDLVKYIMDEMEQGNDLFFRDAPHLAVAYSRDDVSSSSVDAAIAATYFELASPSFEIGTCWAGFFMIFAPYMKKLPEILGIPEDHSIKTAVMFGYPLYRSFQIPKRIKQDIIWA